MRHVIACVFLLGLAILFISQSAERKIDQDELEHLNSAYFITQGETIYLSFFENHPPLTAILLQPVVRSSDDPATMIHRARALMLALSGAILVVVGFLAQPLGGWLSSLLAAVLLLAQTFYFQKTMEVRPDVPALLLLMLGMLLLTRTATRAAYRWPIAAGAVLAVAGLFTPKVIYAAAGATLAACFAASGKADRGRGRAALETFALITAGAAVVAAIATAELARRGVLKSFFTDVVWTSLRLTIDDPAAFRWLYLQTTLSTNAVCWALAVVGIAVLLRQRSNLPRGHVDILLASLVAGLVGLFLIEAPMRQYFLTFLPQIAIAGAVGLAAILRWSALRWRSSGITAVILAVLLAATVPPIIALDSAASPMTGQLEVLGKVRELTTPTERVLDCWTGLYLTRLPAYRYFFLNSDIQRLIPPETLEQDLLRVLEDPRVTLFIEDGYCRNLPPNVRRLVVENFSRTPGFPFLWRRR